MDPTPEETADAVFIPSDTWQLIVRAAQWISHPDLHTWVIGTHAGIQNAMRHDLENFAHHVSETEKNRSIPGR